MKYLAALILIIILVVSAFANDDAITKTKKLAQLDTPGGKVLKAALKEIQEKVIIKGSCWDWVNHVFTKAGYPWGKRKRIFYTKKSGPYADLTLLKAGDWIMFKNLSYGNVAHSGIFLYWVDKKNNYAMVLSYRGEQSETPGRYKIYDLTYLFGIDRGKE